MTKQALVVGGSSGLGLEIAKLLRETYDIVHITGQEDPDLRKLKYHLLQLTPYIRGDLWKRVEHLVTSVGKIDLLVYAAGFHLEGPIEKMNEAQINAMLDVGLTAPVYLTRLFMQHHGSLPGFIAITSTSQWTPREHEAIYTAVKSGLGMFANSLSKDPRVGKVLVAGPAGMKTKFWRDAPDKDTATFLEPSWVAEQIFAAYETDFSYKLMKLVREPARVEIAEER